MEEPERYDRSVTIYYVTPVDWKLSPRIELLDHATMMNQVKNLSKRFEQEWEKLECAMDALGALRPQLPELASASGERMR